jgi:DNA-binding FadR family transcriptional regulator
MQNEKLGHRVAKVLAGRIVEAASSESELILPTEREIADEFGVSMTVAREVVALLASMMMVRVHHGRRMQVMAESAWNYLHPVMLALQDGEGTRRLIAELFDLRILIEPEGAARAALKASEASVERMSELLGRFRASPPYTEEFYECDVAFHQEIMTASANRPLAHILDSANELLKASRYANESSPAWSSTLVDEQHRAILDAIRDRDPEGARAAMRMHLQWGLAHIAGNDDPTRDLRNDGRTPATGKSRRQRSAAHAAGATVG